MKVFLSWSGDTTQRIARAFHELLPEAIEAVDPWMSEHDIPKGSRPVNELDAAVRNADFGIVFLTRRNQRAQYLNWESGAILGKGGVLWTYLIGINPGEVQGPLADVQHTFATATDTLKLLNEMNESLKRMGAHSVPDHLFVERFSQFWTGLSPVLSDVLRIETRHWEDPDPFSIAHYKAEAALWERRGKRWRFMLEAIFNRALDAGLPDSPDPLKGLSHKELTEFIAAMRSIIDDDDDYQEPEPYAGIVEWPQ